MIGRNHVFPSIYDAWAVLRVRQWLIFAPLPIAGVVRLNELLTARVWHVIAAMIVSGLALAYGYGINAIFDRASDEDPHKNVLAGRERVPVSAVLAVVGSGGFALWGSMELGHIAFISIAMSIVAGTIYSAGPRLKRFPVLGLVGNWLIFAPLMASALRPGEVPNGFPALFVVFTLLITQNQLLHEEADVSEDIAAGAWTTARWLGPRGTRMTSWALAVGIASAGTLAPNWKGMAICFAAALSSILIVTYVEFANIRRKKHRYLAAITGIALFLVLLRQS